MAAVRAKTARKECFSRCCTQSSPENDQQQKGQDFRQQQIGRTGYLGKVIWNARVMALLEAVGYDVKKKALRRTPRIMREGFLPCIWKKLVLHDVQLSVAPPDDPDRAHFARMREEEARMPARDRLFIERFVEFCTSRMNYAPFPTWDDEHEGAFRPFERLLHRFVLDCNLDPSLEQFADVRNATGIPMRRDPDVGRSWHPPFLALCPLFGLDPYPLYLLWLAEHHYLHENEQRSVERTLAIMSSYPREYVYVRHWFQHLWQCMNIRAFCLPREVAEQQIRTWHHAHNTVAPGQMPPPHADRVHYCSQHGLKKPLVEESETTHFHQGDINITLDPCSMEMYCRAPIQALKKRYLKPDGVDEERRRLFYEYIGVQEMIACARTPLQTAHMFGTVLQLHKDLILMCPFCSGYTYLSKEKFCTPLGFSCSECAQIIRDAWERTMLNNFRYCCNMCPALKLHTAGEVWRHVLWDDTCRVAPWPFWRVVYLCKQHNKPDVGRHPAMLSLHNVQLRVLNMLVRRSVWDEARRAYAVTYVPRLDQPIWAFSQRTSGLDRTRNCL